MKNILFLLFPLALLEGSMLSDAESIEKKYEITLAKSPPPSLLPQTEELLNSASVWFSIDLDTLSVPKNTSALEMLTQDAFWDTLLDIGIQGLYLENLKMGGSFQTALSIDPKWGSKAWPKLTMAAQKRNIVLIGDSIGPATGVGPDFELALKKVGDYPSLYHLIEVDPSDWKWLPSLPIGAGVTNVPWLTLQELYKKGYIPEKSHPYIKQSDWNVTGKITGLDGVVRRWLYLKQNQNDPVLSWLSPSFVANRIASGDTLYRIYNLNQKISCIDASLPHIAKEIQALMTRKIGGFTVQKNSQTLQDLKTSCCDASMDTLTRSALLHALITEDSQILRFIYRLFLEEKIPSMNLVHVLQPFDQFACEWTEFAMNPKKTYSYFEEQITGELLKQKLLKEDLLRLNSSREKTLPLSTWAGYCALAPSVMGIKDFEKKKDEIQKVHELLAFTYSMQPGIFSLSAADILGALPEHAQNLDLMGPNPETLYPALCYQLQNPHSFASSLRKILSIRQSSQIARGELIAVAPVNNRSSLLLIHRLPKSRFIQLLAVNFGRETVQEQIEMADIQQTTAIDLMSSLTQEKVFSSGLFTFQLPPLSGKVFLFQPKYFD